MIVLAVFTDGRDDLLDRTIASAAEHLQGPISYRVIFDDTGDVSHADALMRRYARQGFAVGSSGRRRGFGGSIRWAWDQLCDFARFQEPYVFHLEDDFTFNRYVDLAEMARVLDGQPHLAQLALRRQPWNDEERAAGGIVELHPDDYAEVGDGQATWLEHSRFFSTNPSLYRRSLCERGWPDVEHSEGIFSIDLFTDPVVRCGFWGARDSGEAVEHIGRERAGVGY